MKHCEYCQKELNKRQRRFCSIVCNLTCQNKKRQKHEKLKKNCKQCGNEFDSNVGINTKFCSWDCTNKWKSITYKGRKLTDEWREKQNVAKRDPSWIKEGDYICERCQKEFKTNTALRSHKAYCSSVDEKRDVQCELCGKIFKRCRNLKTHMLLKHDEQRNKELKKNVVIGCLKRETQKTSHAEIEFFDTVKLLYPDAIHKFKITECSHEYDYFVPSQNLIIEYDGDYWHGNPEKFKLTHAMKIQYNIDISNTQNAISKGYVIHRIWASESHLYPSKTRAPLCKSNNQK